jgi:hypothetical protein
MEKVTLTKIDKTRTSSMAIVTIARRKVIVWRKTATRRKMMRRTRGPRTQA